MDGCLDLRHIEMMRNIHTREEPLANRIQLNQKLDGKHLSVNCEVIALDEH